MATLPPTIRGAQPNPYLAGAQTNPAMFRRPPQIQTGFGNMAGIQSAFAGGGMQPYQDNPALLNQQIADIHQASDPYWLKKMYSPASNSGVASSAATEQLIAPHLGMANAQVRGLQQTFPYERGLGNAQYNLQRQRLKGADVLGQANNLFGLNEMQSDFDLNGYLSQLGILGQLLGGFGGGMDDLLGGY